MFGMVTLVCCDKTLGKHTRVVNVAVLLVGRGGAWGNTHPVSTLPIPVSILNGDVTDAHTNMKIIKLMIWPACQAVC